MISVVCIGIENQGNLGAIARVMANFGISDLILVNPQCEIGKEAFDRASHAKQLLKKAKILRGKDALEKTAKKFDYLVATTSKLGTDYNISRSPITPDQLREVIDVRKKIAVVFGRESHGLSNEEIEQCDFIVTIPTSSPYPVMNLSHACSVILYELSKLILPEDKKTGQHITAISRAEKDQLLKLLDETLKGMHFLTERRKKTQR